MINESSSVHQSRTHRISEGRKLPPFPPFGKALQSLSRHEHRNEAWLYFGHGNTWSRAQWRHSCKLPVLLLPPDGQPEGYSWRVHGWQILAVQIGSYPIHRIPLLARQLLRQGAAIVRVIYDEGNLVVYRPWGRRVAA